MLPLISMRVYLILYRHNLRDKSLASIWKMVCLQANCCLTTA